MRAGSAALSVDLALKAVLVGLLIFAAARQDLPQFHGKSMTGRAIGYPLRRWSSRSAGGSSRGAAPSGSRLRSTSSSWRRS
jgi:hypothetical protein